MGPLGLPGRQEHRLRRPKDITPVEGRHLTDPLINMGADFSLHGDCQPSFEQLEQFACCGVTKKPASSGNNPTRSSLASSPESFTSPYGSSVAQDNPEIVPFPPLPRLASGRHSGGHSSARMYIGTPHVTPQKEFEVRFCTT